MLTFISNNISVSTIYCKPTYEGGCQNHENFRLAHYSDREYTLEECYTMCSVMRECAGFFLTDSNKDCALFRKGCESKPSVPLKYYSLDDCRFGIYLPITHFI